MPEPERLRDSTQIVFPCEDLTEVRERLETEFAVTVVATDEAVCRIVGSPVATEAAGRFLARHGLTVAWPRGTHGRPVENDGSKRFLPSTANGWVWMISRD